MSIAPSEYWSRLVQTGLADAAGCERYADALRQSAIGSGALDSDTIAAFLIQTGVLTAFQASNLIQATPPALRIGTFVIKSDQPIMPFAHWIPVQTAVTQQASESRHGVLLRVPLAGLDESRRNWLAVHSEIESETLQAVELSGGAQSGDPAQTVEIFSPLPEGASLWQVLQTNPSLSTRKTVRVGCDLAAALQALHGASSPQRVIAHGAVGPDHVWVTPDCHALLLRDPSSPARSPRADLSTSWIARLDSPALCAAPELADPAASPTAASDIYSLGCLLFSLIIGRPAFSGDDDRELFAAHNEALPQELSEALAKGSSGNPILRVLAFAMAKDPGSRFESAAAFGEALARAGELVDGKPPTRPGNRKTSPSRHASQTKTIALDQDAAPQNLRPGSEIAPSPNPKALSKPETQSADVSPRQSRPAAAPSTSEAPATARPSLDQTSQGSPQVIPQPDPGTGTQLRKRRKRKKHRLPILAGMMVLPLLMLALAIALRGRGPEPPPRRPRPNPNIVKNVPRVAESRRAVASNDGPTLVNGFEIIQSDRLLWVPPHAADSPPPPLSLLPPGPAAILSVPLARVLDNLDAKPLLETFAAEIESLTTGAVKRAGVPSDKIARCTAALFPGKNGWPDVALAIELTDPVDLKTMTTQWGVVESRAGDAVIFLTEDGDGDAYFIGGGNRGKLPEDARVQRFAVGSLARMREVAETEGASIPLVRSMQTLWDQTSIESDFVALATPNFLFADGRQMLTTSMPQFRPPLKSWLIPDVAAVSLSASAIDALLYVELRELPSGGATPATLLKSFRRAVASWPGWIEGFFVQSVPDQSWRRLAFRLPSMLRFVGQQTRSTILDETVVASTYLPIDAGSQVALATLFAMNTEPGGEEIANMPKAKPLTVEEILARPMSISFVQLSLQFAVDAVVEEFKQSLPEESSIPKVRIVGSDLEKNGITQNQQIRGFERNDRPLRQVLTDLVLGANPDKTATGPRDEKQSLVWVVHPAGKPARETEILITTRDAAKDRYELPVEFRLGEE